MSELYLIAHKVRGAPAFDIAERMPELDEGDELGWIIPTSGHRAHPYWDMKMPYVEWQGELRLALGQTIWTVPPMPASLPDHYPTAAEPRNSPAAGHGLLARLGLLRKTTIKRRV